MEKSLPAIPVKRYFTIGEVSELCGVKPYVLRYWEQEFTQLKPMKRRGNRRYYQHHEVLLIRRIRELLYEQGFTISGARNRLTESGQGRRATEGRLQSAAKDVLDLLRKPVEAQGAKNAPAANSLPREAAETRSSPVTPDMAWGSDAEALQEIREELLSIRMLLAS